MRRVSPMRIPKPESAEPLPAAEAEAPVARRTLRRLATPAGNQAAQRRYAAALTNGWAVSQPGDPSELAAERAARRISTGGSIPGPLGEPRPAGGAPALQRFPSGSRPTGPAGNYPPLVQGALVGGGRPLPSAERAFFEPRFGHNFSGVRVHTDPNAAASAQTLNAQAYTAGQDIVFAPGRYAPETTTGRKLLAHELAHVVQNTAGEGEAIRRYPGEALVEGFGTLVGEGVETAEELGSSAIKSVSGAVDTVGGAVKGGITALIEYFAPGALDFFGGIQNYISEQVTSGFDSVFGGLGGLVEEQGIAGAFVTVLSEFAGGALKGLGKVIAFDCAVLGKTASLLMDIGLQLGGAVVEAIRTGAGAVADFFSALWENYGAPAADALASFASGIWQGIVDTVNGWWEQLLPLRTKAAEAWDWVVSNLLGAWESVQGFLTDLFASVVEKWDEIKAEIKPFMGYVKGALLVLSLFTPMGPFIILGGLAYGLYELVSYLWQVLGQPLTAAVRKFLVEQVIPGIQRGLHQVGLAIQAAQAWLAGLAAQLSAYIVSLLEALGVFPYLQLAQQYFNELSAQVQAFAEAVQVQLAEIATGVLQFVEDAIEFLQPVFEFMRQSVLIAVFGPWAILDDGVWNTVKMLAAFAQQVPCIREIAGLIQLPTLMERAERFRTAVKSAWAIIQNPEPIIQALHDALAPMVARVPGVAANLIASQIYPYEEQHRQGVARHLQPAIDKLMTDWWEELKHMGWVILWPWGDVAERLPHLVRNGWEALTALLDLEIGTATDKFLAFMQDVNAILGAVWGWFALAAVLIGGVLGALGVEFSAGATIAAGAGAGWALAETVGLVLLGMTAATETAVIAKSMFDIRFTNQTISDEERRLAANEEDYRQIANSTFTIAVLAAMFLLGAVAQKIASAIWSRVGPLLPEFRGAREFLNRPRGRVGEPVEGTPPAEARPVEFTPEEIETRMRTARERAQNPENIRDVTDPEFVDRYDAEIQLDDGHSIRRNRETGRWCLFSGPSKCGLDLGADVNRTADTALAREIPGLAAGEEVTVPYKSTRTRAQVLEVTENWVKIRYRSRAGGAGDVTEWIPRERFERMLAEGDAIRWTQERQRLMDSRPPYAEGQVDAVWEAAKDPNGRVFDPDGKELFWDRSRPRNDQWHMGHKPGQEYVKLVDRYVNGEITWDEFIHEYTDPNNYRPEDPSLNVGHGREL